MLKLSPYPGRGIPDAGNESNLEHRDHFGYPVFVCWRADDAAGKSVKIMVGFPFINSERINGILLMDRDAIEAAANANYQIRDTEVVLFAQVG